MLTRLLTQPSPTDTTLTWGPDNRTIVEDGRYIISLKNPSAKEACIPGMPIRLDRLCGDRIVRPLLVSQRFYTTDTFGVYYVRGNS